MACALAHWGGHQARGQPTFRQQFSSAAAVMSARALAKCHKTTSPAIKGLPPPPKGKHLCGHLTQCLAECVKATGNQWLGANVVDMDTCLTPCLTQRGLGGH